MNEFLRLLTGYTHSRVLGWESVRWFNEGEKTQTTQTNKKTKKQGNQKTSTPNKRTPQETKETNKKSCNTHPPTPLFGRFFPPFEYHKGKIKHKSIPFTKSKTLLNAYFGQILLRLLYFNKMFCITHEQETDWDNRFENFHFN